MSSVEQFEQERAPLRGRFALNDLMVAAAATLLLATGIVATSIGSGLAYHVLFYGIPGPIDRFVTVGSLVTLLYLLQMLVSEPPTIEHLLRSQDGVAHLLTRWTIAFAMLTVVGVLTKTSGSYSRGWLLAFYGVGLVALPVLDLALRRLAARLGNAGLLVPRRVMIVGLAAELDRLRGGVDRQGGNSRVVSMWAIDRETGLDPSNVGAGTVAQADVLPRVVVQARQLAIDDVVLALPWSDTRRIDEAVQALSVLPVAIHLDATVLTDRFGPLAATRFGAMTGVSLTERPLRPVQALVKRAVDLVVAVIALLALSPLLILVGLLIKLDSPGPVFFRQRRRGFNHQEFRIWKFRTMSVLEDGDTIRQATAQDLRVTRVGAWLRRTNVDELPQLINVLCGHMAIVGPRPHAVAHDREFETRIANYARRLNVRPGITGWAQIHGLRGETDTDDKMARRVEHDLYYIDHWSLPLDLYIMVCTAVSPTSFRNAR